MHTHGYRPGLQWQQVLSLGFAAAAVLLVESPCCCLSWWHCEVLSWGLFSHWGVCFVPSGGSDAPGTAEATGPSPLPQGCRWGGSTKAKKIPVRFTHWTRQLRCRFTPTNRGRSCLIWPPSGGVEGWIYIKMKKKIEDSMTWLETACL